jgi:chromosome segregation ATPase
MEADVSVLNGPGAAVDDASDETVAELRQARLEITALRSELAGVAPHIEDLKQQLTAARLQGERYRRQVEEIRHSSSWRLTKPLRLLSRRAPESR